MLNELKKDKVKLLLYLIIIIELFLLIGLSIYRISEFRFNKQEEISNDEQNKDNDENNSNNEKEEDNKLSNILDYENLNCSITNGIDAIQNCYDDLENSLNSLYQDKNTKIVINKDVDYMAIQFNDKEKQEFKHALFGSVGKTLVFKLNKFYVILNMTHSQAFRSIALIFDKEGNLLQTLGYEELLNSVSSKYVEFDTEKKQIIEVQKNQYCITENNVKEIRKIYNYTDTDIILSDTINVYCNEDNTIAKKVLYFYEQEGNLYVDE